MRRIKSWWSVAALAVAGIVFCFWQLASNPRESSTLLQTYASSSAHAKFAEHQASANMWLIPAVVCALLLILAVERAQRQARRRRREIRQSQSPFAQSNITVMSAWNAAWPARAKPVRTAHNREAFVARCHIPHEPHELYAVPTPPGRARPSR